MNIGKLVLRKPDDRAPADSSTLPKALDHTRQRLHHGSGPGAPSWARSGSFRTGSEEHSDPVRDLLGSVLGGRGQEPGTSGPGPGARPRRPQPLNLRSLPGCLARGISRNIFLYPLVLTP